MLKQLTLYILISFFSFSAPAAGEKIILSCTNPQFPHVQLSADFIQEEETHIIAGSFSLVVNPEDPTLAPTQRPMDSFETEMHESEKQVWDISYYFGVTLHKEKNWNVSLQMPEWENPVSLKCNQ